jgi:hypothetical protein
MKPERLILIVTIALIGWGCSAPQLKKTDLMAELRMSDRPESQKRLPMVCVGPFTLTRGVPDPLIAGEANVGPLNGPMPIRTGEPVQEIIMNQVKRGLAEAGFKLEVNGECAYEISGRIERFWVGERSGSFIERAKASVRYDLIIRDRDGAFLWGDTIEGRESAEDKWDVTKHDIPTLVKALNKSVESIFAREEFWKNFRK